MHIFLFVFVYALFIIYYPLYDFVKYRDIDFSRHNGDKSKKRRN